MGKIRDKKGRFLKGYHYSPETELKKGTHWRPRQKWWNNDWLYEEYIIKKKSAFDIAKENNTTGNNILYWLEKLNVPKRNTSESRKVKYWGSKGKDNPMYNKRGKLNPNWQGGKSPFRQMKYGRSEWKEIRKNILKRDNYFCQICKTKYKKENKLIIHHWFPICCFPEFIDKEWNLITLCENCHKKIHKAKFFRVDYPEQFKELFLQGKIK